MYHGLEFSRRTFGVLFGLFLLAFLIDVVSEKAYRDFTEGFALEQEVWRLRSENMRAERAIKEWNESVVRQWAILHPDDPEKAMRESERLMVALTQERK